MVRSSTDEGVGKFNPAINNSAPDDSTLVDYINNMRSPPSIVTVAEKFNVSEDQFALLEERLHKLKNDGLISDNWRSIPDDAISVGIEVLKIIDFDDNGDAIAKISDANDEHQLKIRVHLDRRPGFAPAIGQKILARIFHVGVTMAEAKIIRVLEHSQKYVFGMVVKTRDSFELLPAKRGIRDRLRIQEADTVNVKSGDLVQAQVLTSRNYLRNKIKILKNFGNVSSPRAFSALALSEFNIRHQFPKSVTGQAEKLAIPSLEDRHDLRNHAFVTIDGADAHDFDDAIFAERSEQGGWRILVAIADVSYFVLPESGLDIEARKRGNSVYLPDHVVPMLPEKISNDLCSLKPNEDRAAIVAEIHISNFGKRLSYCFKRALIKSHARLTYDQVQVFFDNNTIEPDCNVPSEVLNNLFEAWGALARNRSMRNPLALNVKERRVELDESGQPIKISLNSQTTSQRLIEDFMVAANVAAADMLVASNHPSVFRVHNTPDRKKVAKLSQITKTLGTNFKVGQVLRPSHFNKILKLAKGTSEELLINELVLRSQAKALYSVENIGHFGLSLRNYVHFTSPIRRYADLLVHRAIIAAIDKPERKTDDHLSQRNLEQISRICRHISDTEAAATAAERRTIDRFAAGLVKKRIGEILQGIIVSITHFGAFVRFDEGTNDGLISLRALPEDFYNFDEKREVLEGRRKGWTFAIGMPLIVKIIDANLVSGGILLEWVEGGKKNTTSQVVNHNAKQNRKKKWARKRS